MFLLWGSLIRTGSFLYIDHQLLLGFVFVDWTSGIVYLVTAINVEAIGTSPVRPGTV
jgi:hypothetical protein